MRIWESLLCQALRTLYVTFRGDVNRLIHAITISCDSCHLISPHTPVPPQHNTHLFERFLK